VFDDFIGGIIMRKKEAALDIESIPKLNFILISHAHMDHLSINSLNNLDDKFPKSDLIFPEGVEKYLPGYDFNMVKLKMGNSKKRDFTGETTTIDSMKITTVFADHFGGRYGLDSYSWNVPGCTGYIIQYKDLTVYFGGDTKYNEEAFKRLGEKFKIDLALIPIGPCRDCYAEESSPMGHCTSREALKILDDLKASFMIPIHYGALQYFADPDEPVFALQDMMTDNRSYKEKVKILKEGEQMIFEKKE
jgi:L-ascorbate metabolism protein UlaG (beta-lactamase superfamily)